MRAHALTTMTSRQALFDLIGVLARKRHHLAEEEYTALGLNHTEARLLTIIRERGGSMPQEDLSQRVGIDRTNTGRALQKLENKGYLLRESDETDRRAKFIRLTTKGSSAAAEIAEIRKQLALTFFGSLSELQAQRIVGELETALADEATPGEEGAR